MIKKSTKDIPFDYISLILLTGFSTLQITRWVILPESMDIYYHLLTAWGFIQAGGYSNWDFWQYAPLGRVHIYPPFFHLLLASLIKLGINKIILLKLFEVIMPITFLFLVWWFIRRYFNKALALFVLIMCSSANLFYLNLIKHIPATMAVIFGILALGELFSKRFVRSLVFLVLCFYTHIGIAWFFILSILLYGIFNRDDRRVSFRVVSFGLFCSSPIITNQLLNIKYISRMGVSLNEINLAQFKPLEYILAISALFIIFKLNKKYRLFLGFFLAAFIFLTYPYRFVSSEGYLPIIFLSAVTIENLYYKLRARYITKVFFILFLIFIFLGSLVVKKDNSEDKRGHYKILLGSSAFLNMLMPQDEKYGLSGSIWFPEEYLPAATFLQQNSEENDIIYCTDNLLGVCLASLAGRPTANGLFIEIDARERFDPIVNSKIIVLTQDDDLGKFKPIIDHYRLLKIKESKLFIFYKNPFCDLKMKSKPRLISFGAIWSLWLLGALFFFKVPKN